MKRVSRGLGSSVVTLNPSDQASFYMDPLGAGGNASCVSCPKGTVCSEVGMVLAELPLAAGYWRASAISIDARKCRVEDACPGVPFWRHNQKLWANGQCTEGFEGPLCGVCSRDYRSTPSGHCTPCAENAWVSWTVAAAVLVVIVAGLSLVLWRRKARARAATAADQRRLSAKIEKVRRLSASLTPADTKSGSSWRGVLAVLIVPFGAGLWIERGPCH